MTKRAVRSERKNTPVEIPAETDFAALRRALISWFAQQGRSLPWRETRDPYAVTVSEFMLQQTQVNSVLPYYARWMREFPTIRDLAVASEQSVLSLWQGLGYYSRARNLQRFAVAVVRDFDGNIPADYAALRNLPGIGDYTASAILAFAFDQPSAVIDANVARVLSRLFDCQIPVDTSAGKEFLAARSWELQEKKQGYRLNSAIMELGALVCRSGLPECLMCPARPHCQTTEPATLPRKAPRAKTTKLDQHVAWISDGTRLWLRQSSGPRWKGMWVLPEIPGPPENAPLASIEYPITRYRMTMRIYSAGKKSTAAEDVPFSWDELEALPIPSPYRRAVAAARASVHTP